MPDARVPVAEEIAGLRVLPAGPVVPLAGEVTTTGPRLRVDLALADPAVSPLHAEVVRRGPHVYVSDLGLSRSGTRVNGTPVARRLLADGDVIGLGSPGGASADRPLRLRRTPCPPRAPSVRCPT